MLFVFVVGGGGPAGVVGATVRLLEMVRGMPEGAAVGAVLAAGALGVVGVALGAGKADWRSNCFLNWSELFGV